MDTAGRVSGVEPRRVLRVVGLRCSAGEAGLSFIQLPVPRQQHLLSVLCKFKCIKCSIFMATMIFFYHVVSMFSALCSGPE